METMKTVKTTTLLWEAVEDNGILDGSRIILLEHLEQEYDGIFETPQDWMKFANSVTDSHWLAQWLTNGENSISKADGDKVTYTFANPIKVKTGFYITNGERTDVISHISSITFQLDYEFSWKRGDNFASAIDIYGKVVDLK